jgi:hypothetical protein
MWSKARATISLSLPATGTIRSKGNLLPSSIISKANRGTGKVALGGRLTRTVLYDFRVKNSSCRIPGATFTMD